MQISDIIILAIVLGLKTIIFYHKKNICNNYF